MLVGWTPVQVWVTPLFMTHHPLSQTIHLHPVLTLVGLYKTVAGTGTPRPLLMSQVTWVKAGLLNRACQPALLIQTGQL